MIYPSNTIELDAAYFHHEIIIFEINVMIAEAMRTGREYQTIVEPPPGPPVDEEGEFVTIEEWICLLSLYGFRT